MTTKEGDISKLVLGRVQGPARGDRNEMAQCMPKANGEVVPQNTYRPLQVAKRHSPIESDVSIERGLWVTLRPSMI